MFQRITHYKRWTVMFHMERDAIHFACDQGSQFGWTQSIATFADTMNRCGATISLETGYKLLINVESANPAGLVTNPKGSNDKSPPSGAATSPWAQQGVKVKVGGRFRGNKTDIQLLRHHSVLITWFNGILFWTGTTQDGFFKGVQLT